ncbi:MAG: hypothetical protein ACRDSJ_17695, partial [Rubrobacteraceae bacterium]
PQRTTERADTSPRPPERTGSLETTVERTAPEGDVDFSYGYTHGRPSGNLVVDGEGRLPLSGPLDVALGGEPVWVVGVPFREGVAWVVALRDGSIRDFYQDVPGGIDPLEVTPDRLPPGAPPLVRVGGGSLEIVPGSPLTHPLPVDGALVGVEEDGDVYLEDGGSRASTNASAPPDARIVKSESGTVAFLSSPTERYAHGVLGDAIEAAGITMAEIGENDAPEVLTEIVPESGGVFESISPLWFEAPGEGELLAVSESADGVGSRVSVYSPDGRLAAAGPFIGEPFKWRHVLAAGPFGQNGELEVAAVRTPHLDAVVEFYRPEFETGTLEIVAEVPGYASHRLDTRNLDTARAGDLDDDGSWELLVPNRTYTELAAIRRTPDGAEVEWALPVGGETRTNIASATDPEGRAAVAVGRSDGALRIWR